MKLLYIDAATTYADNKEHKRAVETLQILIAHEDGANRLLLMAKKIRCQIKLGEDYISTCKEMASTLKQINLQNQPTTVMNELHDEIKLLVESFTTINVDSFLLLQSCRFDLIIGFFDGQSRLDKLKGIGSSNLSIAKKLNKQNKGIHFKQQYPLMDKILKEMQRIGDVDLKVKFETIAWFLRYYGHCCHKAADHDKSIEIYKQAISLMESTFGDDANHHRVLGFCYDNLGVAYENSNKLVEAKQCYETAVKVKKLVKDWVDENQRLESILFTTRSIQGVKAKEKHPMAILKKIIGSK